MANTAASKRKRTFSSKGTKKSKKNTAGYSRLPSIKKVGYIAPRGQYMKTNLIYNDSFTIDAGIASAGVYVFAANGLYDCDITGTGHQPTGFDQLMALYTEYVVTASKITIQAINTNDSASPIPLVLITIKDFATTSSDVRVYIENGNCVQSLLTAKDGSKSATVLSHYVNLKDYSTQDIFNEDNFAGSITANPSDTHYWHVVCGPFDGVSNLSSVSFRATIEYEVYFRNPALTALS